MPIDTTQVPTIEDIDGFNYEEALTWWRYAPVGHPLFRVSTPRSRAFHARMNELTATTSYRDRVAASKKVGWPS